MTLTRAGRALLLVVAGWLATAAFGQISSARSPLVVVLDDSYPPYAFRAPDGRLQGILPDQWALWSRKTGIPVELKAMDWAEAQRMMREEQADILDTVFMTDDRAQRYAFTRPYARIDVPLYAHRDLGGIVDIPSLQGFTVGVKAGDAVIERLAAGGIETLKAFPSYEAIVLAAKRNEIKVFSIDQPAAVYFLTKHGLAGEFHQSFVIYSGQFHRAVPKSRPDLLQLVQRGFDAISRREYRVIDRKWMGSPFLLGEMLRHWGPWLLGGLAVILALALGNVILGRRVAARTGELQRALGEVRQSLDAQQRSEEAKSAMQTQLTNAQKLETVGRLAGGVAHDFNNMLQVILGYAEIAMEQVSPDTPLRGMVEEIYNTAQRSSAIARQLQTFAGKQPLAPRVLNINAGIEKMSGMLGRILGERVHLEWRPAPDLGDVMMDTGQIDQIVTNLCINARDAMNSNGHITIETANAEVSPEEARELNGLAPGACVRLSVRDDGHGIPPEIRDRIFDPFFTTKAPGHGTGLGLAIVYGIVKQNGGAIQVQSEPGRGTAFHIYLPRCRSAASAAASTGETDAPRAAANETILLVDDETSILLPTGRSLEQLGYRVLTSDSPGEALRIFEARGETIDLLITDVIMPGMNGPEMVRRMLIRRPDLKYLFISGHTSNLLAEQGLGECKGVCLPKPFNRATLARHVRTALLSGWRVHE